MLTRTRFVVAVGLLVGGASVQSWADCPGSSIDLFTGGNPGIIEALASHGGQVILGGTFALNDALSYNVAAYDGTSIAPLGGIGDGVVYDLISDGTTLYAVGNFSTIGGQAISDVAAWDGTSWSGLGTGGANGPVYAAIKVGGLLYIGGQFTSVGGVPAANIAIWDGSTWSEVAGSGGWLTNDVVAFEYWNNTLIVGLANGAVYSLVGTTFTSFNSPGGGLLKDLQVHQGKLFAGGDFRMRRWNGTQWVREWLDAPPQVPINALSSDGNYLYCIDNRSYVYYFGSDRFIQMTRVMSPTGQEQGRTRAVLATGGSVYTGGELARVTIPIDSNVDMNRIDLGNMPPTFAVQPSSVDTRVGLPVTFDSRADVLLDASSIRYQWFKNNNAIPGATLRTYSITNVVATSAGDYFVRAEWPCGTGFSATATLTIRPPCAGDFNNDFTIGLSDLATLLAQFGRCDDGSANFPLFLDLDGSLCIDLPDLAQLLSVFGTPCP